ncbi:amidohydrolase family protein [Catenulispora sp. NL8]|uniref:Amidohydrolase family protein n=1 Tax=Catenulispora pinistramenti TaxID=2705254 RepID=A0ABS5KVI4_9ACTN|nr:amidohydrolase family protein [Catenulispora pinistramenti]MBS2549990.1 amidohydrolase family protein [Catenulispora pinistramenti]
MTEQPHRTAVTNVRVFDGRRLLPVGTVVFEQGRLVADTTTGQARVVDGGGGVLLPGLIDAHVHLYGRENLEQLAAFGVTTALDMGSAPPEFVDSLRGIAGFTDIRSAGTPAIAPGSGHSHIPVVGQRGLVHGAHAAAAFVAERVAEGSDYIKIVVGSSGADHDQATLDALVIAAHEHGRLVVAHASHQAAVQKSLLAGADVLTHVPMDRPVDAATASRIAAEGRIVVPTLSMMEGIIEQSAPPGARYEVPRDGVSELYRAGVPILAGTDANTAVGVPARISHGESLHHELQLLFDAGVSAVDALRAATSLPARYFGLDDRGTVEPGRRADLVLIDGDPLQDIKATSSISRVWCGGVEYTPA